MRQIVGAIVGRKRAIARFDVGRRLPVRIERLQARGKYAPRRCCSFGNDGLSTHGIPRKNSDREIIAAKSFAVAIVPRTPRACATLAPWQLRHGTCSFSSNANSLL